MKKTISINIKGINFLIEEDAYEMLQAYLNRLSNSLKNEKGSKEIIDDIEIRISELCSLLISDNKQVIELTDIESILSNLGNPEDFIEEEETTSYREDKTEYRKEGKRLFRNVDSGKVAGVCSGLAAYLNIDVIFVRGLFLLMFFMGGFAIPLYIILWIITPKANSSIDRLRMQGRPITVDTVREEVEAAAKRFENETHSFANRLRKNGDLSQRFRSVISVFRLMIGIGCMLFGLGTLISILTFGVVEMQFIPAQTDFGFLSLDQLGELVMESQEDALWMKNCAMILGFSIVLFFCLLGIKLIFNLKNKWTSGVLGTLFSVGLVTGIACAIIGIKTGREMAIDSRLEKTLGVANVTELVVKPNALITSAGNGYKIKNNHFSGLVSLKGNQIKNTDIEFIYRVSEDSLFHVRQELRASSSIYSYAEVKASHIRHYAELDSNVLRLNTYYTYPKKDKLRNQSVRIIIEIPKGKTVRMPHHVISLDEIHRHDNFDQEDGFDPYYEQEGRLEGNGEYYHYEEW